MFLNTRQIEVSSFSQPTAFLRKSVLYIKLHAWNLRWFADLTVYFCLPEGRKLDFWIPRWSQQGAS